MKYIDFYQKLKNGYPVVSRADIKKITHNSVLDVQLSDWVKKGLLIKPRNNIYFLKDNENINPFLLSNRMFSPSYVSLESALFYFGLIPDVVSSITAVTTKKTRKFDFNNQLFLYQKIKDDLFFGYQHIKNGQWGFLIAIPEKALLDYFYLNLPRLKSKDSWDELRIDPIVYSKLISRPILLKLLRAFHSEKLNIIKEFDKYLRT